MNIQRKCISCGNMLGENSKFCAKCGTPVEAIKCPVCGKTINPVEVSCKHCSANLIDLVNNDLKNKDVTINLLTKTKDFEEIQPTGRMFRLAYLNSIVGLVSVYMYETTAKRAGTYNSHFTLFVYGELPADDWDKPPVEGQEFLSPRNRYASKEEYLEEIRKDSKRPNFDFLTWMTTYAKSGNDISAYQLCITLASLYTRIGDLFDSRTMFISECGIESQQQAYALLSVARTKHFQIFSKDDVAKELFSTVRYKMARHFFTLEYMGFNEPEEGNFSMKYYMLFQDGYKRALDAIKEPIPEDKTCAKLLRGLLNYNYGNNQAFIENWNAACNDANYINSEKDFIDDGIFSTSAICMSSIARGDRNIDAAMGMLRFAYSHITRKHWAESLQEEYSRYQQDRYGNYFYVE